MNEKNVIVFHIGMPKTGTTALQNFLEMNNEQLRQKNWIYPLGKNSQSPLRLWNRCGLGGNGSCLINESMFDSSLNEFLEYADRYNVIISCESIWSANGVGGPEKFFRSVLKRYGNIKVVVYLRRQDEYTESLYRELVINWIRESRTLEEYSQDPYFKACHCDYLSKLKSLEKLVGDRLIVRRYTKDTITDFLSLIGVKLENPDISPDVKNYNFNNLSLGSRILELKRIMNGFRNLPQRFEGIIRKLNIDNIGSGRKDFYKIMPPEMRQKILDEYAADNEEIARRYLKDGKPLFENMNVDIPYKEYRATPLEEEMIRVFLSFMHDLDTQINEIAVHVFKGDRKLAYFGAGTICEECLKTGLFRPDIIIDDKGGREIDGIPVVSFDEIENWKDYYVIITTSRYLAVNSRRLQSEGLVFTHDYTTFHRLNFLSLDWHKD